MNKKRGLTEEVTEYAVPTQRELIGPEIGKFKPASRETLYF
jgi:hypothetical protein